MDNDREIHDFEIEEMIRCDNVKKCTCSTSNLNWRHRAQYAVGHALNDFYTLAPQVRKEISIQYLIERHWPRKMDDFDHPLHYWSVHNKIVEELTRVASSARIEKVSVPAEEIEVYTLLRGRKHVFPRGSLPLQQSLDYVSMLTGLNRWSIDMKKCCERCKNSRTSTMDHPHLIT
ncbi:hypothetical protein [Paenibacillus sp. DS2015]|uniref:hypothetical protein n=1 Tax=Paenibacillus sp. DS2015 TaxID=3373917 RepID=UPI003D1DC7A8